MHVPPHPQSAAATLPPSSLPPPFSLPLAHTPDASHPLSQAHNARHSNKRSAPTYERTRTHRLVERRRADGRAPRRERRRTTGRCGSLSFMSSEPEPAQTLSAECLRVCGHTHISSHSRHPARRLNPRAIDPRIQRRQGRAAGAAGAGDGAAAAAGVRGHHEAPPPPPPPPLQPRGSRHGRHCAAGSWRTQTAARTSGREGKRRCGCEERLKPASSFGSASLWRGSRAAARRKSPCIGRASKRGPQDEGFQREPRQESVASRQSEDF